MTPLNIYMQNDLLLGGSAAVRLSPTALEESLVSSLERCATLDRPMAGASNMYAGILAGPSRA